MNTSLREQQVTVRKRHRCEWCNELINEGEKAWTRVGVFEGDFVWGWQHPECYEAMVDSDLSPDEGFYPGDFPRGGTEWPDAPELETLIKGNENG